MKVLCWMEYHLPDIGGVEVFTGQLVPALQRRGHELSVVASMSRPDAPRQSRGAGYPIHRFPLHAALQSSNLAAVKAVAGEVRELVAALRPDLVHLHFSGPGCFFLFHSEALRGVPLLATIHAPLQQSGYGPTSLSSRLLKRADWIVGVSRGLLDDLCAIFPSLAPRSSVILNGLEMPAHVPAPVCLAPPRILCIGRMVEEKGFDIAIAAFAILMARFPEARLAIAGDGPARAALHQRAAELGVRERVEFTGWIPPDQVCALIDASSMVVVPSRWPEPFGLVALQAGQMARPVIAARLGGLPEVVIEGETGLLVAPESPQALCEAMASLLEQPEAAARMGAAGRHRAREVFGMDTVATAYDALYCELIGAPERTSRQAEGADSGVTLER